MFEVQPDEVDAEFAVELHETRAVRTIEDAESDTVVLERGGEVVRGLCDSHTRICRHNWIKVGDRIDGRSQ